MSIISVYEADRSGMMYKRFASLASSYLDTPEEARRPTDHVPLENLFRLLEMYRYDAFSDESRTGILAIENANDHFVMHPAENVWHTNIKNALNGAIQTVFVNTPKDQAVEELEETLRSLSNNGDIEPDNLERAKSFFKKFLEELNK